MESLTLGDELTPPSTPETTCPGSLPPPFNGVANRIRRFSGCRRKQALVSIATCVTWKSGGPNGEMWLT